MKIMYVYLLIKIEAVPTVIKNKNANKENSIYITNKNFRDN
jgi:hypothetical protein